MYADLLKTGDLFEENSIFLEKVEYSGNYPDRIGGRTLQEYLRLYTGKQHRFKWENELRAFFISPSEVDGNGCHVPVDLEYLIENIYVSPKVQEKAKTLTERCSLKVDVKNSHLCKFAKIPKMPTGKGDKIMRERTVNEQYYEAISRSFTILGKSMNDELVLDLTPDSDINDLEGVIPEVLRLLNSQLFGKCNEVLPLGDNPYRISEEGFVIQGQEILILDHLQIKQTLRYIYTHFSYAIEGSRNDQFPQDFPLFVDALVLLSALEHSNQRKPPPAPRKFVPPSTGEMIECEGIRYYFREGGGVCDSESGDSYS